MEVLFLFKNANASSLLQTAICLVKTHPTDDRITFGLYTSVLVSQQITAVTFAASAIRNNAPKLPGFSTPSTTKKIGFSSCFISFN